MTDLLPTPSSHSNRKLWSYRVLNVLSFILVVVTFGYYLGGHHTLGGISKHHPSPYTPNNTLIFVYEVIVFIWQIIFLSTLWSSNSETLNTAIDGVKHSYIFYNLFSFAWALLWVRGHFFWAEIFIILEVLVLAHVYLRHLKFAKQGAAFWAVKVPFKLLFAVALIDVFHVGAVAVHCHRDRLVCSITANVFIWFLGAWAFLIITVFKDFIIGLAFSYLFLAIAIGQILLKVIALQYIFAFTISGILFVTTLVTFAHSKRGLPETDAERAPLIPESVQN